MLSTSPGWLAISIHALREEGDTASIRAGRLLPRRFLSTPSARRATHGLAMFL